MKPALFIICIFGCILLTNCQKEEQHSINQYFTIIGDTLKIPGSYYGEIALNVDIDKDKISDINFLFHNSYSSLFGAEYFNLITPLNGYGLLQKDTIIETWDWNQLNQDTVFYSDTVMIPKVLNIGDTIRADAKYIQEPVMFNFYWFPIGPAAGRSSIKIFGIWGLTDYYIVLARKGKSNKLAWIKLTNGENGTGLIIQSCMFEDNIDYMVIEDSTY